MCKLSYIQMLCYLSKVILAKQKYGCAGKIKSIFWWMCSPSQGLDLTIENYNGLTRCKTYDHFTNITHSISKVYLLVLVYTAYNLWAIERLMTCMYVRNKMNDCLCSPKVNYGTLLYLLDVPAFLCNMFLPYTVRFNFFPFAYIVFRKWEYAGIERIHTNMKRVFSGISEHVANIFVPFCIGWNRLNIFYI